MKALIFFLAILLVIVHAIGLQKCSRSQTEAELARRAQERLEVEKQYSEVNVSVSHFDTTLKGTVANEDQKIAAEVAVRDAAPAGRRRIVNHLRVEALRPMILTAALNDGVMNFSGVVPSENIRTQLQAAALTVPAVDSVEMRDLRVNPKSSVGDWLSSMPGFLGSFFRETRNGKIDAKGDALALSGEFFDSKDREQSRVRAQAMVKNPSHLYDNTTMTQLSAPGLEITRSGGQSDIAAILPATASGRALQSMLLQRNPDAKIELTREVANAPWLSSVIATSDTFFSKVAGDGRLSIGDKSLQLMGEVATPADKKAAAKLFSGEEWSRLTIENGLGLVSVKPLMLAIRSNGPDLTVDGTVGSPQEKQKVLNWVGRGKPTINLVDRLKIQPGVKVPSWWSTFPQMFQRFNAEAEDAELRVNGDAVSITGEMKAGGNLRAFRQQLAGIQGLPSLDLSKVSWPKLRFPNLQLLRSGNKLALRGEVPSDEARDEITAVISQAEPDLDLTADLRVASDLTKMKWVTDFSSWWPKMRGEVPNAAFRIREAQMDVVGVTADQNGKGKVTNLFGEFGQGLKLNLASLKLPQLTFPNLALRRKGSKIHLTGEVPSALIKEQIVAAVKKTEPGVQIQDQLRIGSNLRTPKWMLSFGSWWPKMKSAANNGEFEFTNTAFNIWGDGASPKSAAQIADAVPLDGGWKLASNLKLPEWRWPNLALQRGEGGNVVLQGEVPTVMVREAILDTVRKGEAEVEVIDRMKVSPGVKPAPWLTQFSGWWPQVKSTIPNATFKLKDQKLEIQGVGNDRSGQPRLAGIFARMPGFKMTMPNVSWPEWRLPTMALKRNPNNIVIAGELPTEEEKAKVLAAVRSNEKPDAKIVDQLRVSSGVKTADWLSKFPTWWPKLRRSVPNAGFALRGNDIELEGDAKSPTAQAELKGFFAGLPNFNVSMPMVKMPSWRMPSLSLKRSPGEVVVSGSLPSAAEKTKILASVRNSETNTKIVDRLEVDPAVKSEPWLSKFPTWWPKLKGSVPNASFDMKEGGIELEGEAKSPDAQKELAGLFGDLPDFKLQMPKLKLPKWRMASLSLKRDKGKVLVTGEVPNESEKTKILTSVRDGEKTAKVIDQLQVKSGVKSADWIAKFPNWWPKFKKAAPDASFDLKADGLDLKGAPNDPAAQKELAGLFGDLPNFKLNIPNVTMPEVPRDLRLPSLSIRPDGRRKLVLDGEVHAKAIKDQVRQAVEASNPGTQVSDRIKVTNEVETAPWLTTFPKWWSTMKRDVQNPSFGFAKNQVDLRGDAVRPQSPAQIAGLMQTTFGNGVDLRHVEISLPRTKEPSLVIVSTPGQLTATGEIGSAVEKQKVLETLRKSGSKISTNALKVSSDVKKSAWIPKVAEFSVNFANQAQNARVEVVKRNASVSGIVRSESAKRKLSTEFATSLETGFKLKQGITVVPMKSPELELRRKGQAIELVGKVPNEQIRGEILATVKKAEPKARIVNQMTVGNDVESSRWLRDFKTWWPKLHQEVPDAVFVTNSTSSRASGHSKTKKGPQQVASLMKGVMGNEVQLDIIAPRTQTPWVTMEGDAKAVRLIGAIASTQEQAQLIGSLRGFKGKIDQLELRVSDDVKTASWRSTAGGFYKNLVDATNGKAVLEVRANQTSLISGEVADAKERDKFASLASSAIQGFKLDNQLTFPKAKAKDPNPMPAAKPIQATSVPKMDDVLPQESVYFQTNSAYVSALETRELRDLVDQLNQRSDKKGLTMVLIGHADWRGNASYNQELSRRRADSVLKTLQGMGVTTKIVSVQAKGERNASSQKAGAKAWSKDRRVDVRVGQEAPQ